ncbi:hypothetical protein [Methanobrevibacter sp.]
MKKIYSYFGGDEKSTKSENYYLQNILELLKNKMIISSKTNNYYLRELYLYYGGISLDKRKSDIYYLKQIMELTEGSTPSETSIKISSDNVLLSEHREDIAWISVKLTGDDVANKTIEVTVTGNDLHIIEEYVTDKNGNVRFLYESKGEGDITFEAKYNDVSDTVTIEDCLYFNDGTLNDLVVQNGINVTVENDALKITTNYTSERKFYFPHKAQTSSDNVMLEIESAKENETGNVMTISIHENNAMSSMGWCGYWTDTGTWDVNLAGTTQKVPAAFKKGDKIRFIRKDNMSKFYHNDNLLGSATRYPYQFYFGGYTNYHRVQRIKNIKIKKI